MICHWWRWFSFLVGVVNCRSLTSLRSGRDDKVVAMVQVCGWCSEPQIPPLRFAPVGMTKVSNKCQWACCWQDKLTGSEPR
jgi:hypothetical protein